MATKLVNLGNQNQSSLVECNDKGIPAVPQSKPELMCGAEKKPGGPGGWLQDVSNKKLGFGENQLCDPMQSGKLENDPDERRVVNRYSRAIRACDEAMQDLFKGMIVIDEDGKSHPIPIIWASQEKAVAAIIQDNVRKDESLVVDRIKLPMLAIYSNSFQTNMKRYIYHKAINYMNELKLGNKPGFTIKETYERDTIFGVAAGIPVDIGYTLYAWTLYNEDMMQILEQCLLKFSPCAYIRVRGVPWEVAVKLNSMSNNLNIEPGDQDIRVVKFEFNMTAETYIPQPIVREKAVLKTNVNLFNTVENPDITEVYSRLEEAVEELR